MEPDQKGPAPRRLAAHDGERIGSITVTPALRGGDGFYLRSSPMLSSVAPLHLSAVFSPPPVSALEIGRASCRGRVCQYVSISVVAVSLKKKTWYQHDTQQDKQQAQQ